MYDEFKKVNEQSYQVNVRSGFVYNGVFPLLVLVANIGTAIVVYFGGLEVLNHTISAGRLVPLCAGHQTALVSLNQHCVVLEPVPTGSGRQRASLRLD